MIGSKECLERAALMERHATETHDPKVREDFIDLAQGWRDLAKHALARESAAEDGGPRH